MHQIDTNQDDLHEQEKLSLILGPLPLAERDTVARQKFGCQRAFRQEFGGKGANYALNARKHRGYIVVDK